jgi:RNA polymerase sigma factor (sigma-70 family)
MLPTQRQLDEQRASREAVTKVSEYIWLAVGRHGVPCSDRNDLVHDILLAALEGWPSYDAEIASPQKWLNGIIVHHVKRWRARRAKHPLPKKADQELLDGARSAEELLMSEERRKLTHQLYQEIPFKYRDAMIAHELDGLTLGEIAVSRGIPVATAHRYVQKGKQLFSEALARWQKKQRTRGVLLLPLTVKALLDADRTIPPAPEEVVELAWRLVQERLGRTGLDVDADDQGQGNGPRQEEDTDSPAPAPPRAEAEEDSPHRVVPAAAPEPPLPLPPEASARSPLGPLGVGLLVGLITGAWLASVVRASREPIAREEASIVSAAPPVASVAIWAAPSTMASAALPEPPATAAAPAGTASADSPDSAAEQTAFDIARAAFAQGRMPAALQALAEHAKRYPRGRNAPERDQMWIEALLNVGRTAEACQRAESFRRAYPNADYVKRLRELCFRTR